MKLLEFFHEAPLEEIKPLHIAQYRDWRVEMTRKRLLQSKRNVPINAGHVRANRELALFSHIWNKGREWGYTEKTNPCAGIKKHREKGRDVYVDKTGTRLRIEITGRLSSVLTRIAARKAAHKIYSLALVCDEEGAPLSQTTLRSRFDRAREKAGISKQMFQFRDLRAKAATEKEQSAGMEEAKKQLGHTSETMTKRYVRNRIGTLVKPTQ
ncbi:tyrosine-type recombinase/integrase [Candidatus Glomeribacter gigasporarum]|uniref:tyrosine-type recombinase/integrase n=1 Tax=Candidatus Glomeribacter gigasporarum TaxID=132144 RepID=UPI0002DC5CBD|nr:tyrosine-type recombinase/integrase [Candidatus Glomeribacter gigasporarum]